MVIQVKRLGFFQKAERSTSKALTFSLTNARPGDSLQIVALKGDKSNDRLRVMGLIPGALIEVM
ncbi:MAG: FeoA domain-containing protein, partial [Phormidesmis sp.]